MSAPGVGCVSRVQCVYVEVDEAGFKDGYGNVVLVHVRYGWSEDIETLETCLAAVVSGDEAWQCSECCRLVFWASPYAIGLGWAEFVRVNAPYLDALV